MCTCSSLADVQSLNCRMIVFKWETCLYLIAEIQNKNTAKTTFAGWSRGMVNVIFLVPSSLQCQQNKTSRPIPVALHFEHVVTLDTDVVLEKTLFLWSVQSQINTKTKAENDILLHAKMPHSHRIYSHLIQTVVHTNTAWDLNESSNVNDSLWWQICTVLLRCAKQEFWIKLQCCLYHSAAIIRKKSLTGPVRTSLQTIHSDIITGFATFLCSRRSPMLLRSFWHSVVTKKASRNGFAIFLYFSDFFHTSKECQFSMFKFKYNYNTKSTK